MLNNKYVLLTLCVSAIVGASLISTPSTEVKVVHKPADTAFVPKFSATDIHGKQVTQASFNGKFSIYFFGFTNCPDICPTTLAKLTNAYEALTPEKQNQLNVAFITIDPKRDTLEHIKEYVTAFNENFTALWHTEAALNDTLSSFNTYREVSEEDENGSYTVSHSGFVYITNKKGRYVKHLPHRASVNKITEELNALIPPSSML